MVVVRPIGPYALCARRIVVRICAAMALAACGSQGGGVYGELPPGQIGFVGSGGGRFDGGLLRADAGAGAADSGPRKDASSGNQEPTDGGGIEDVDVDDGAPADGGSSVGIMLNLPPGFFASLDWVIEGPAGSYSGTVQFGEARSIEFVVGGIKAGDGYAITLSGFDVDGQPCSGTSAKFSVSPGATTGAGVLIQCATGDGATAATVSSGNVAIEAGVSLGP
jgi:hypothetical protein